MREQIFNGERATWDELQLFIMLNLATPNDTFKEKIEGMGWSVDDVEAEMLKRGWTANELEKLLEEGRTE